MSASKRNREWKPTPAQRRREHLEFAVSETIKVLTEESEGHDLREFTQDFLQKLVGKLVKTLHLDKDVIFRRATDEEHRLRFEESD